MEFAWRAEYEKAWWYHNRTYDNAVECKWGDKKKKKERRMFSHLVVPLIGALIAALASHQNISELPTFWITLGCAYVVQYSCKNDITNDGSELKHPFLFPSFYCKQEFCHVHPSVRLSVCMCLLSAAKPFPRFSLNSVQFFTKTCWTITSSVNIGSVAAAFCRF